MKTQNLIMIAMAAVTVAWTSNASALHVYRTEACVSKTLRLAYTGNYAVGGDYAVNLKKDKLDKDEFVALPIEDNENEKVGEYAQILIRQIKHKKITKVKKSSDGCYDTEEWKSRVTYKFEKMTEDAAKKLGIEEGDQIVFLCKESESSPVGPKCFEE